MSTGRMMMKEFYVGFLLLLLTFLYLSHLTDAVEVRVEDAEAVKAYLNPTSDANELKELTIS